MLFRFSSAAEAAAFNDNALSALTTPTRTFVAIDQGPHLPELHSAMPAQQTLNLKLGTQVMLIRHVDGYLAHGAVGKVIGFSNRFPERLPHSSPGPVEILWPLVRFPGPRSGWQLKLVEPFMFSVKVGQDVQVNRTQVCC